SNLNLANNPLSLPPYVQQISTRGPIQIFQYYTARANLLGVSVGSVALLIGGLILFFISMIMGLFVEQQGDRIAFLQSRGATRGQVVGSFSLQAGLLALPVLVLGPFLAYQLAIWFSQITLQGDDKTAVSVLTNQPVESILGTGWIALLMVVLPLLVMVFVLFQRLGANVITSRQESMRKSQSALWARWRLDLVGAAVALVGASFALYLANSGILNARTRALVMPVILLGCFLGILVAFLLLLSRFFPALLQGAATLALRGKGAIAVLAIAQMARRSWQAVRMGLLFAFTLAFALFSLTFNSSQTQRVINSVGFQVGSDFSGVLSGPGSVSDWQETMQSYTQIPGVQSATIGHIGIMENRSSISLQAVDAGTYAQTMYWTASDPVPEISSLLKQMVMRRQSNIEAKLIPAIVDAGAAQSMSLSIGTPFSLRDANGSINFVTIGIISHIPAIVDDGTNGGTSDATVAGGVLADYATFASVQLAANGWADDAETLWLKTSGDPTVLAGIRREINSGQAQLSSVSDRRSITAGLAYDPLETAVRAVLLAGGAVALILGLVGSLLGSWASARSRVVNFATMRALGNTLAQILGVILCEQIIIYTFALILGIAGGLLFSWVVTPGLLYTPVINVGILQSISSSGGLDLTGISHLYLIQEAPAAQVVIPGLSILALLGVVIAISMGTLVIMMRIAVRPAMSEILRLSQN
ncbi:MAG TPA: FtsX-like permease family protein, partial [Ktedonobacteraceae bacterium]|nr:FtsX-like permease family protein [Ktedonobacteraceae bacterium]